MDQGTPSPCHWATTLIPLSLGAPPCDCLKDDSDEEALRQREGLGVMQGHPHASPDARAPSTGGPASLATFL